MRTYAIVGIIFAILSFVTFVFYVVDKIKAVNGRWRIPEKVLLSLSFLGGGAGGYLAMFASRHKTKKVYFHVVNVLGIALQVSIIILLAIYVK